MAKVIGRIIKFALLIGLIVLGIVFMPPDFVARAKDKAVAAKDFIQGEALNRLPEINRQLNQKFDATQEEAAAMWKSAKQKFDETVGRWVWEQINGKFPKQ